MAIKTQKETIDGANLMKVWSDKLVKIQYTRDFNVYSVLYISQDAYKDGDFIETQVPVPMDGGDLSWLSGPIHTRDVVDIQTELSSTLSSQILKVLDIADGEEDDTAIFGGGGANG